MSQAILFAAISVTTFLFAYMLFKLGERQEVFDEEGNPSGSGGEHFLLQLLLLFFIAGGVLLLGKVSIDDYCTTTVVNATLVGNTTNYDYEYACYDNNNQTAIVFYKTVLWFVRLLALYVFGYFTYRVLVFIGWVVPK